MIKVAIIDDHQLFRKSLEMLVNAIENCAVVYEGSDARLLLCYLVENHVDIVLLDIQMPEMDGFQACCAIRTDFPEMKVLMISQLTTPESIRQIIELGANGYFSKNSDPDELRNAITSVHENGFYFGNDLGAIIREAILWENTLGRILPKSKISLTPREIEIIKLVSKGYGTKQIASLLGLTNRTVDTHRARIITKTRSNNFIGAVLFALKGNYFTLDEV